MSRRPAHRRSTVFDLLRGLSPLRTRTGFGRMVATTVTVLISLLLVGSVGPVYADGTTGTSTDTTAVASTTTDTGTDSSTSTDTGTGADPGGDPTADPSATPSDSPASDAGSSSDDSSTPSSAPSPSDSTSPSDSSTTDNGSKVTATSPMLTTALASVTPMSSTATCKDVGGFEIDGNTQPGDCTDTVDWDSATVQSNGGHQVDGFEDSTGFKQGAAENTDPTTWVITQDLTHNDKNDIGQAWAYSAVGTDGDVYGYFGLTNLSIAGGSGNYDLEYNQLANQSGATAGLSVPNRSPGDLLFRFASNGKGSLDFTDAKIYANQSDWGNRDCFAVGGTDPVAGWCTMDKPDAAFASKTNADGTFVEGAIDLTTLFGAGKSCSGTFGATQIRSVTGGPTGFSTSSLKDYVKPLNVTTPSTCATLKIQKEDLDGKLISGATFKVSPNPTPGGSGDLVITDGATADPNVAGAVADGKADGVITIAPATPNVKYTVTEVAPPPGYFLPTNPVQTVTPGKSSEETLTFKDPKKWDLLTATKTVTSATYTRTYDWTIDKGVGDTTSGPFAKSDTKTVPAGSNGNSADFGYQIKVHENGYQDSGWKVTGAITVTNTNDAPVVANVSDQLAGATCLVNGAATAQVTVPANGSASPTYECTFTTANAPDVTKGATNGATVTWSKADYPNTQGDVGTTGNYIASASKTFSWTENSVHKSVTVTDTKYDFGGVGSWGITYGSGSSPDHVQTYSRTVAGTVGKCVDSPNTATLTATDDSSYTKSSSATATVCVGADLTVSKNVVTSLTRTYGWQLTKTAKEARVDVDPATGKATVDYQVELKAAGSADSLWQMSGKVTVTNPNTFQDITMSSLVDLYTGAGGKTEPVLCTFSDFTGHETVAAGKSQVYNYSCTFSGQPDYDGTNTATASWTNTGQGAPVTPDTSAKDAVSVTSGDWTLDKEINKSVSIYDDGGLGGSGDKISGPFTWTSDFDQTFTYSADYSTGPGTCTTVTNTAWAAAGTASSTDSTAALPGTKSSADSEVCAAALTLVKKVENGLDGTATPADWTLTATPGTGSAVSGNGDPTTAGGVDKVLVAPGTFGLSESGGPAGYTQLGWSCVDGSGQQISTTDSVTVASGADVTCTVTNAKAGTWQVVKTSTPDDGSVVDPGTPITYHVTVTKTGGVDPTNVVVIDDLTDVVSHTSQPTFTAPSGTTVVYNPTTHQLKWTIADLSSPVTLDYTVTVSQDALGDTLVNHVTSTGSDNCPPNPQQESADCTTTHYTPAWTLTKSSDPTSGSTVDPGDTVTYTLTATNTGPAPLVGAQASDDLSAVLDDAVLKTPLAAGLSFDGDHTLTWDVPTLAKAGAKGDTATVSYTVTVNDDAVGATLTNLATPTTPGGSCATQGGCTTTQYTPAWTLSKSSDPASHQQVLPGDTVTYTLTATNTGPAPLVGAQASDDLSNVLDDAVLDTPLAAGLSFDGDHTLTWDLPTLAKAGAGGDTATVSYTVTVNDDAVGATLHNVATPTTPGGSCVVDRCDTWHHTPEWTLTKSSDPATGATVQPGDTITYTLTVDNTGPAKLQDAVVTDDLSEVLDNASLQTPLTSGLSFDGDHTLTWDVPDVAKGGSVSVSYSVVVADGAWGVTLKNAATPTTPGGSCTQQCSTTHPTPHYTLSKTSDPATGSSVMPPYLGDPGTTITYTLTAVNDSAGVVKGATVSDDLSGVLDNATFDDASIQASGTGTASRAGDTLTWNLPTLQPQDTATVTYSVTVNTGQWNATLTNVATPDSMGSCALDQDQQPLCSTTQTTPPWTQLVIKKVDDETGAALAGAVFSLASADDPGTVIDTATSGADGLAVFSTKLRPGDFIVTETKAPTGYTIPDTDTLPVTISDPGNFVANGQMGAIEFGDPATGTMAITKQQYRSTDGGATWTLMQPTDTVDYGDEVRYVLNVTSTGPRLHHDVTLTDYVPGYNPADTTSTVKATLVAGSAECTGDLTCSVTEDAASGLVTWSAGTIGDATGTAEMTVTVPPVPSDVVYDANGDYINTVWNEGMLSWTETSSVEGPGSHELTSNPVQATATAHLEVSPPPPPPHHNPPAQPPHGAPTPPEAPTLPNTGGPGWWYLPAGIGLVLLGAGLMIGQEGRRRRRA